MTIRCGTDVIHISRIERTVRRLGHRFLRRIWTPAELALLGLVLPDRSLVQPVTSASDVASQPLNLSPGLLASLAARFAGKEAIAKALGTGIGPHGIEWTDLEILRDASGAPAVRLHGAAKQYYQDLGGQSLALSLSHDQDLAQAFCVMLVA